MIRGLHGLFYSSDADATRAFMRDKLRLPYNDVGEGWLIFDLPEGDVGVHPTEHGGKPNDHDVSFYCDDIAGTVAELRKRGVVFKHDPEDRGYGYVTYFTMPGGVEVQLYEPTYTKGKAARAKAARAKAAKAKAKPAAQKRPAARKRPPAKKSRR
jgi:hypothetical protein